MNKTPSFNEYYQIVKDSEICIDEHIIKSGPVSKLDYYEHKESYVIYFMGKDYDWYYVIYYKNNHDNNIDSYKRINSRLCQEDYEYLHNYTIIENALRGTNGNYSVIITEQRGKKLNESINDFIESPIDLELILNDLKDLLQWLVNKPFYLGGVSPNNIFIYKDVHRPCTYNHLDIQNYYNLQFLDNNEDSKDNLKSKKNKDYYDILKIIFWLKALSINPEIIEIPYDELLDSPTTSSHKAVQDLFNEPIIQKLSSILLLIKNNENVDSLLKFYFSPQKYEHSLPALIPFKLKSHKYSLYDTESSKEIRLYQFNDMHYIDPSLKESSSIIACLVGKLEDKNRFFAYHHLHNYNKNPGQLYTIISKAEDVRKGMFTFYKKLTVILPKCIIAESMSGNCGVIDDFDNKLIDFRFKEIFSIPFKDTKGLLCKDLNENLSIYDTVGNLIISLGKVNYQLCNEFLIYGQEKTILDLSSMKSCRVESNEEYEISYNSGSILSVKFKEGYRYFDTKQNDFINEHFYKSEEKIRDGFALCHRYGQKNVIVYENGIEVPIEFNKELSRYGNQIFMFVESTNNSNGRARCSFTIFKLSKMISSFDVFLDINEEEGSYLSYTIEDECKILIHYKGNKWDRYIENMASFDYIIGTYDLYGKAIEKSQKEEPLKKVYTLSEQEILDEIHKHNIKKRFLDNLHIKDIRELESCYVCNINGLAEVHGEVFGENFGTWTYFIGYADEKKCYWEY